MTSRLILVLCIAVAALAACGKKPSDVLPPQGEENDDFPRTYPSS